MANLCKFQQSNPLFFEWFGIMNVLYIKIIFYFNFILALKRAGVMVLQEPVVAASNLTIRCAFLQLLRRTAVAFGTLRQPCWFRLGAVSFFCFWTAHWLWTAFLNLNFELWIWILNSSLTHSVAIKLLLLHKIHSLP